VQDWPCSQWPAFQYRTFFQSGWGLAHQRGDTVVCGAAIDVPESRRPSLPVLLAAEKMLNQVC